MYFTYVMFYLLYRQQWNSTPVHLHIFFAAKGAIFYVAIATVIFSHVKITCYFHVWEYHVFARKFTWYFIGVYIIKCFPLITFKQSRRSLWRIKTYTYFVVNQSGVKTTCSRIEARETGMASRNWYLFNFRLVKIRTTSFSQSESIEM